VDPLTEERLPRRGHCRYILTQNEIRGQRCACVNFIQNQAVPGMTCDCGHPSCFHTSELENPEQKQELEQLKKRVQLLEAQMCKGNEVNFDKITARVTEVEETLDRSKEEVETQLKGAYRNLNLAWNVIEQGERKNRETGEQLRQVYDRLTNHDEQLRRMEDRQLELQDADLSLEEQLGSLFYDRLAEEDYMPSQGRTGRPRRRSTSDASRPAVPLGEPRRFSHRAAASDFPGAGAGSADTPSDTYNTLTPMAPNRPAQVSARATEVWTVHISLLPQASIAMPFERNTNAYQRCLSRGLHKVVAIAGTDAKSFVDAVSQAFGHLLKGRAWVPLHTKLCDAEPLQGLPMLRPLEPSIIDSPYDADFLRANCAVCDSNGMMDSLYIAMRYSTLSWHTLRHAPVFMEGLEASWKHDPLLDTDPFDDNMMIDEGSRPAAGAIVAFSSLKRPSSEISRSQNFDSFANTSTHEAEGSRAKRTCPAPPPPPQPRRQGVETV
jgi:hypothetical protein